MNRSTLWQDHSILRASVTSLRAQASVTSCICVSVCDVMKHNVRNNLGKKFRSSNRLSTGSDESPVVGMQTSVDVFGHGAKVLAVWV